MIISRQNEECGLQKEATRKLVQARSDLHKLYITHLAIARIALGESSGHADVLRLQGNRKKDMTGWLVQVNGFL